MPNSKKSVVSIGRNASKSRPSTLQGGVVATTGQHRPIAGDRVPRRRRAEVGLGQLVCVQRQELWAPSKRCRRDLEVAPVLAAGEGFVAELLGAAELRRAGDHDVAEVVLGVGRTRRPGGDDQARAGLLDDLSEQVRDRKRRGAVPGAGLRPGSCAARTSCRARSCRRSWSGSSSRVCRQLARVHRSGSGAGTPTRSSCRRGASRSGSAPGSVRRPAPPPRRRSR